MSNDSECIASSIKNIEHSYMRMFTVYDIRLKQKERGKERKFLRKVEKICRSVAQIIVKQCEGELRKNRKDK